MVRSLLCRRSLSLSFSSSPHPTHPQTAPAPPTTPPGKEGSKVLDSHIGTLTSKAKETASVLQKEFRAELKKLQEAEARKQMKR